MKSKGKHDFMLKTLSGWDRGVLGISAGRPDGEGTYNTPPTDSDFGT